MLFTAIKCKLVYSYAHLAVFDVPIGTMIFPIKVNELQFLVFFDYEQAYQGFQNTDF